MGKNVTFLFMVMLCGRFESRPRHYSIGGVFHPTKQLVRFSPPNMPYIVNLFRINPRGEVVNYRSYTSPSFEVTKTRKITDISAVIIIIASVQKLDPE